MTGVRNLPFFPINFAGTSVQSIPVSAASFGAVADVQYPNGNVSIGSGSNNLIATAAVFTPADIGKLISVPGAGVAGAGLSTTITGFINSTTVLLGATASTALVAVPEIIAYGTNNTTALQNWLNSISASGTPGYLPPGSYAINAALSLIIANSLGVNIFGAGGRFSGRSTLVAMNYTQDILDITNGTSVSVNVLIERIQFQGAPNATFSSTLQTGGAFLSSFSTAAPGGVFGTSVKDCRFYGPFTGLSFNNSGWFDIDHCTVENVPNIANTIGIAIRGTGANENTISNTILQGPVTTQHGGASQGNGLFQSNGTNTKIVNSEIFGWANGILVFLDTGAGSGTPCGGLLVANSIIGPNDFAASFNKSTGTSYTNVIFSGNQIVCKQGFSDDANAGWLSGMQIINNWFSLGNGLATGAGPGVVLQNTRDLVVTGNIFTQATAGCTGVSLSSGVANGVVNNNVMDGITTPLTNASTSTIVRDNRGYNPVGTSAGATMGASPFTITAGATPETHYVNQSATNTATMAKGTRAIGTLVNPLTFYTVQLEAFESYVTTWLTTAPTFVRDIH